MLEALDKNPLGGDAGNKPTQTLENTPLWRNGIRSALKMRRPRGRVSSTLTKGTDSDSN